MYTALLSCFESSVVFNVHIIPYTVLTHCKNKMVSTVARNNLNCNLIGRVDCYGYTVTIMK